MQVLELVGNAARDNKKSHIMPRHIQLVVHNDEELSRLLGAVTIVARGSRQRASLATSRREARRRPRDCNEVAWCVVKAPLGMARSFGDGLLRRAPPSNDSLLRLDGNGSGPNGPRSGFSVFLF
jgi:hypothetical protein